MAVTGTNISLTLREVKGAALTHAELDDNQTGLKTAVENHSHDDFIPGPPGLDGASIVSADFVADDLVFTKDDATDIIIAGAKTALTGAPGADGTDGASIVSAAFVSDDLVFTRDDAVDVTIVGGKTALTGATGAAGTAATIAVGTVTGVPAGNPATVTNSGTSSAAVFDFEIPEGDMTNPMTAAGDIIVGGASGAPTRLAKGTDGQVLTVVAGSLVYADAGGGGASVTQTAPISLAQNASTNITGTTVIGVYEEGPAVGSPLLLIHGDGANGGTVITNDGASSVGITNTSVTTSTTQSKFSGSSLYFPGTSGNGLLTEASSDFTSGTRNFTTHCWVYSQAPDNSAIFGTMKTNGSGGVGVTVQTSRAWIGDGGVANGFLLASTPGWCTANTWTHIALVRNGNTFNLYKNGVLAASQVLSVTFSNDRLRIGEAFINGNGSPFTGYIDEFVHVDGLALWTANFSVPTAPTDITLSYEGLKMGVDYKVYRSADAGSQTHTITRLKAGTASMVIDYI